MDLYMEDMQNRIKLNERIFTAVRKAVEQTLRAENQSLSYEVSVVFVDNDRIRGFNRRYRGKDIETDVLSFPMEPEDFLIGKPILGDIMISAEKALEQSIEFGHSLYREISYLTVHSMLHLLGYDHLEDEEKIVMREREKDIMRRLEIFKNGKEDYP